MFPDKRVKKSPLTMFCDVRVNDNESGETQKEVDVGKLNTVKLKLPSSKTVKIWGNCK